MLKSAAQADARDQVDGHGLCCHQKPYRSTYSPPEWKGQGNILYRHIDDCRLSWEWESYEASLTTPTACTSSTKESNSLDRKLLKRTLKNCDRDAEASSPQLLASGRVREDSGFFKALAFRSLTMLHWVSGQHKLNLWFLYGGCCLLFLFLFWGGRVTGVGWGAGRTDSECDRVFCEIPK